jgi:hypothetical protein
MLFGAYVLLVESARPARPIIYRPSYAYEASLAFTSR